MSRLATPLLALLLLGTGGTAGYLLGRTEATTRANAAAAATAPESTAAAPPVPVEVVQVAAPPGATEITASGAIRYRRELPLGFKVPGVVRTVTADIGDRLAAGALLATIDPTEVSARAADARAMQANALQDFERTRTMVQRRYMAPAALDRARMELDRARAAVAATAFDASRAVVRAPVAGVVLARLVEPGQVVGAGSTAVLFGDLASGFVVEVPLADTAVTTLRTGDLATIALADGSTASARVARIAAMADPATGAFDVELAITNANPALRSGMIARARIRASLSPGYTDTARPARLAVPAQAILEGRGDRAAVYRITANNLAERVPVRIAGIDGDVITIDEGLASGDRVVTAGAAYLRHGHPVTVVPASPAAGRAPG